jgi:predicted ester cyclase
MGAAENRDVHTRMTEAENRHDLSQHEDFLHEDIVVHSLGADPVIGIAAYRASMEAQFAAIPDWHVVLEDQFATDDRVACRWLVAGRHIQYAGASLWDFEEGKARRGWIYLDMSDLMAQLQAQT